MRFVLAGLYFGLGCYVFTFTTHNKLEQIVHIIMGLLILSMAVIVLLEPR
jgi:VanZ family protein